MGLFRVVLASFVVIAHLSEGLAATSHLGVFAVTGFYVLSGYLITRVLQDVYRFDGWSFWTNRVLKLFPVYYIGCVFALSLIASFPVKTATFLPSVWAAHPKHADWLAVATIVPMGLGGYTFRPVPSIWSVGVELINYALLFVFTARRASFAAVTLVAALALHALSLANGEPWSLRYAPAPAAALPFAIGALIYFGLRSRPAAMRRGVVAGAAMAWFAVLVAVGVTGGIRPTAGFDVGFYANMLAVSALVVALAAGQVRRQAGIWSEVDRQFGALAYPMFVMHWIVGFVISQSMFGGETRGLGLAFVTLAATVALSRGLCHLQDAIIEPLRDRIRGRRTGAWLATIQQGQRSKG